MYLAMKDFMEGEYNMMALETQYHCHLSYLKSTINLPVKSLRLLQQFQNLYLDLESATWSRISDTKIIGALFVEIKNNRSNSVKTILSQDHVTIFR